MPPFAKSVISRRDFLATFAAVSGSALWPPPLFASPPALRVNAIPTIFFAQPDGRTVLVRFVVEGSTAVAGRLRVYDRSHRQLGTAGVIGVGGRLLGELWLSLDRDTEITSELEVPQVRGILRTVHALRPQRRWTVYWMIAQPGRHAGETDPAFLDHQEFLQLGEGVDPGAMLLDSSGFVGRVVTAPLVLAGSGIRWVGVEHPTLPLERMTSRDGSSVIAIASTEVGKAGGLGRAAGRDEIARRLEQWLTGAGTQLADEGHAVSLIVSGESGDAATFSERIVDWNARFAYPRIVTDHPDELLAIIEKRASPVTRGDAGAGGNDAALQTTVRDPGARAARVFEPLTARLSATATGLGALAEQFAFNTPSTLVVNATPFSQTGIAVMPDGTERVVTDVPALGYVCLPYPGASATPTPSDAGRWIAVPGSENDLTLDARHFQVRIDRETGAIRSLVTRADGREWVQRGAALNFAAGFRLDALQKLRNTGVGSRIVITRKSEAGSLASAITVYEDMPWVDISNQRSGDVERAAYQFAFALESPAPSWEVPAGFDDRPAGTAVDRLVHLRWLKLVSGADTVLLRGLDAPVVAITAAGEIVSHARERRSRYRLGFASGYSAADDAWRFGWGSEPLLAVPVPGSGRARLASYGSLVLVDQGGVSITEFRKDRAGEGVVLFVQELLGAARDITIGPGALMFRGARHVDFLERDLGELPLLAGGGVSVPLRAYGFTALRLTGVELAGG